MTMSHKEALRVADSTLAKMQHFGSLKDLEAAIRAYLDARGLVMVPRVGTPAMYRAGIEANVGPRSTVHGYIYEAMLAAAPDPFKEEGE